MNLSQALAGRDPKVEAQLRELYDLLIGPAVEQLREKQNLIVVPDGAMWSLPFEALRTADHYLVETSTVSRVPSLTAFNAISKLRTSSPIPRRANRAGGEPMLLAFGNPVLSEETTDRIKTLLSADRSGAAPGREAQWQKEAEALGDLYGAGKSAIFTGPDASEARWKSEAGKYRVLHFSSRAILNEAAPLFSAIALASDGESKQDGMLDFRELIDLELKSDLVVLSSSEPAFPQAGMGRSLSGVTWALFIAGCPASLISQWPVESPAITELMLELHRSLKSSRQKAKSWQAAVKQILSRDEYRHPHFWAGFSMLGDAR